MSRKQRVTHGQLNKNERDVLRIVAHLQTVQTFIEPKQVVHHFEEVRENDHCPSRTTIYRVLDRLCDEKPVLRKQHDSEDNREVRYTLTEQGCEVIRELKQEYERVASVETLLESVCEGKSLAEEENPASEKPYQTDGSDIDHNPSTAFEPAVTREIIEFVSDREGETARVDAIASELDIENKIVEEVCQQHPLIFDQIVISSVGSRILLGIEGVRLRSTDFVEGLTGMEGNDA